MNRKAFRCRHIYTATSPDLIDGYVITENDKIIFVGNETEAKAYIDRHTELIDVSDNFLMPGFHDFHVHMVVSGVFEKDGILRDADSAESAAQYLYTLHKNNLGKKWIMGGAWDPLLWPGQKLPTKYILDKYFPNTPVFLLNKECHGAWVNTAALKTFNITKDTTNPPNGAYERLEDGEPSGYIHEAAAVMMQERIFQDTSNEAFADYAKSFIKKANQNGITSVGDVAGGTSIPADVYKLLEEQNDLTVRVHYYPDINEGVKSILEKQKRFNSTKLSCCGAKAFIDGTPQGHSGYMIADYCDMPGNCGYPLTEPETFINQICDFDEAGIQTRVHACGDAGVRLCLDAIEKAQKRNGSKGLRHCVEHLEVMAPEDIPRFGKLNAIASVQPEHMPKHDFYQHPFHKILGENRMNYSWPFGSIQAAGGVLAFGTDAPVVDISPFRGIFRAVTRMTNELEPKGGWNPTECISIHEALRAYTWGSAYAARRDHELGTIEKGKLADMVIVEHNLFDCAMDKQAMFDMKIVMTIMDGIIVYENER